MMNNHESKTTAVRKNSAFKKDQPTDRSKKEFSDGDTLLQKLGNSWVDKKQPTLKKS